MSIRLMSAAWGVALPDSEKLVLLALADCANDEGGCWPSMATLAKKCSKSDRTVQAAIKALVAGGHLTRTEKPGRGCFYTVHPRTDCAPEAAAPPKPATPTPEAASDKPSRTIIPSPAKAGSGKRAKGKPTLVPSDFVPEAKDGSITAKAMAAWPPGELEEQIEHFIDHHTAHGTESLNWQASWRTWVKHSKKFNRSARNVRPANDRPNEQFSSSLARRGVARATERRTGPHGEHEGLAAGRA